MDHIDSIVVVSCTMRRSNVLLRFIPSVYGFNNVPGSAACLLNDALPSGPAPSMAYATIPAGHRSSDLRQEVCNIGLNRRRDLTLRGDIKVSTTEGPQRLSTLLKVAALCHLCVLVRFLLHVYYRFFMFLVQGHVSAIFGLPDLGSVCGNQVASFMESADALKAAGVKKILCVSVNKTSVVDQWLKERGANTIVQGVADDTGALTRMLGVNVNDPERPQLRCQRYSV